MRRKEFRVDCDTFHLFVEMLELRMRRLDTVLRRSVPVKLRVACALYKLATGNSGTHTGSHLGLGPSPVWGICYEFNLVLNQEWIQEIIKLPSGEASTKNFRGF